MAQTATRDALSFLETAQPLPAFSAVALRVAVVTAKWAERSRTRAALSQLDDHILRDVGLDRREAFSESRRKFWQG